MISLIDFRSTRRSPQASAETPANPQEPATKKANRERLAFSYWWRRRESNPRPRALSHRHYMLSPVFDLTDCYPTGREDKRRSR